MFAKMGLPLANYFSIGNRAGVVCMTIVTGDFIEPGEIGRTGDKCWGIISSRHIWRDSVLKSKLAQHEEGTRCKLRTCSIK